MSGHSKWATIKHQKGAADAKRGKLFSRLSKAISIAVKEGGGDDPDSNPKLRLCIDKAKQANMPKENIKRAIDKGAGRIAGATYEEIVYEGFGPSQVAIMVECVTDNRNRTNSEIKSLIDKNGGTMGSKGSVAYNFERKGKIVVAIPADKDPEEMQLELIDFGAEDFTQEGTMLTVLVDPSQTQTVADQITAAGFTVEDAEIEMVPNVYVDVSPQATKSVEKFLQLVDDYDDVQKIYHNANFPE